jgi:hypothetical protein
MVFMALILRASSSSLAMATLHQLSDVRSRRRIGGDEVLEITQPSTVHDEREHVD